MPPRQLRYCALAHMNK